MRQAPSAAVVRRATLSYRGGGILWDGWHNVFGDVWAFSWAICGTFTNENGDQKKYMLETVRPNHILIASTTFVLRYRSNHFSTAQLANLAVKLF